MADLIASTVVVSATTLAIPKARKYLGAVAKAGANAVICLVYKGTAATASQEVGAVTAPANTSNSDSPGFACDTDNGLFVDVSGAAGFAIIRYST
jgi:hypothetical protein